MEIVLQYFDGCPNWKVAEERLDVIAAERPDIAVTRQLVETFDEAERVGFHGSPSILIDGVDPFADPDAGVGLACRIYRTPDGPAGAPTLEQLRAAIALANQAGAPTVQATATQHTDPVDLGLDKATATAALSPHARRVQLLVLSQFAETGRPPSRAELVRLATEHGADPQAVLTELVESDVVLFDAAGEVRAAYPFSPTPTAIQVSRSDGPTVYAMCAIDALGMSAMLGQPTVVTAAEPDTGRRVTVEVDHDRAHWTPPTAVVYNGALDDPCCPAADRTCGHINFFTSTDAAEDWASRHPTVSGTVLEQPHALAAGIAEFATMLRPHETA